MVFFHLTSHLRHHFAEASVVKEGYGGRPALLRDGEGRVSCGGVVF